MSRMHPFHPVLVHFPLAFLLVGSGAHALYAFSPSEMLWTFTLYLTGLGLCFALPALLAGLHDFYIRIVRSKRTDTYTQAGLHILAVLTALCGYGACLLYSIKSGAGNVSMVVLLPLSGFSAMALIVGGWLGGEMVYRHGIGQIEQSEDQAQRVKTDPL
ncbi:MAG: DUF2231 domain-containing protein [Alphaproteobacteria bacterium]